MNTDNFVIWQRRECPAWCTRTHQHLHAPVNRACQCEEPGIALSMSTAHAGGENLGPHMTTAIAGLEQEPREYEPHLVLSLPTSVENLTLAEADSLSRLLARLVNEAREGAKGVDWR